MSRLIKDKKLTVIPGDPGSPAIPGRPYIPEHTILVPEQVLSDINHTLFFVNNSGLLNSIGYDIPALSGRIVYYTGYRVVTVPAQTAYPPTPGVAPTPAQISYGLDYGWTSWARSIDQLVAGQYYESTFPVGISAAFIGVGPKGSEMPDIGHFRHGVLVSKTGVKIFERGVVMATVRAPYLATTKVRCVRLESNVVVYVVITDLETLVYVSGVTQFWATTPMYVYGYLYKSGDEVSSSTISTGKVSFGRA